MKRQIKFGMAVTVLLLFSIGIAAAIPAVPAIYSGNVTINVTTAPDGTKVFAQVNNSVGYVYQTGSVSVSSGRYSSLAVGETLLAQEDLTGQTVRFYIQKSGENACLASPTTTTFSSGQQTQDIILVIPPCIAPLTPSTGTPTPTPTPTGTGGTGSSGSSGSGSSGGGGGGGVTSGENFSNIAKSETRDGSLTAGKPVEFTFKSPEFAIYQILITGKENENDVSIKVEHLKNTSRLVSRTAPGTVYVNENVWVNSKKISKVILKFRVTNAWIIGSNVQKEKIKLLRWSDSDWKALDTVVLNSDDTYTYFESPSAGLSSFAISAVKEGQVLVEKAASPGTTATTPISNTSTPGKPTPGFGMLVAVMAISAIYLLTRRDG